MARIAATLARSFSRDAKGLRWALSSASRMRLSTAATPGAAWQAPAARRRVPGAPLTASVRFQAPSVYESRANVCSSLGGARRTPVIDTPVEATGRVK